MGRQEKVRRSKVEAAQPKFFYSSRLLVPLPSTSPLFLRSPFWHGACASFRLNYGWTFGESGKGVTILPSHPGLRRCVRCSNSPHTHAYAVVPRQPGFSLPAASPPGFVSLSFTVGGRHARHPPFLSFSEEEES